MTIALTVVLCLIIAAFISSIMVGMAKCPVYVPLILLCVIELIRVLPLK